MSAPGTFGFQGRRMMRGSTDEPETRVGMCCGDACKASNELAYRLLFKVQGFYRYRCDSCYQAETGRRHYMAAQMGFTLRGFAWFLFCFAVIGIAIINQWSQAL